MHIADRSRLTWHTIKFDKYEAPASPCPYRPNIITEYTQAAKQQRNFSPTGERKLS
jgi:hypothetical protein